MALRDPYPRSGALRLILLLCLLAPAARAVGFTEATLRELGAALEAGTVTSERLVTLALARIEAYDDRGPAINAVLRVHPRALERARALDRERRASGPRSPLHGIPVVLKDNLDTADLPTTAGSFLLHDSLPPDDAFLVRRLREAGALILAKVNLSEFASGDATNSVDGPTYNPHDPTRTPSGSSGGTGAAVAAGYAPLGLGTDTGGSVRGPSSANGIVGLKPTLGLLSRDGIVPLALSFDTAGPMARHVEDVAVALNVLARTDPADPATARTDGRREDDYTRFLDPDALQGARIGVARQFLGGDREVDWVVEASLRTLTGAGAEVVDVTLPEWLMEARGRLYRTIRYPEFKAQIADYLGTLRPDLPKSLEDLIAASAPLTARQPARDPGAAGPPRARPNPSRWSLMLREVEAGPLTDPEYRAVREHGLPLLRAVIGGLMEAQRLDAVVYPTSPTRPRRADRDPRPDRGPGSGESAVVLANMTGFPDLIVPAGFTARGLPVTLSFLGPAFSEGRLLALGYAFEQRTRARRLPAATPELPGEALEP